MEDMPFSEMPPEEGLWDCGGLLSPYMPSLEDNTLKALHQANLSQEDTLIDLGCGDGTVLFKAVELGCKKAIGVELNSELATKAQEKAQTLGLSEKLEVIIGDFLSVGTKQADIVYVYLLPEALKMLKSMLWDSVSRGCTRVVISAVFKIPDWEGTEEASDSLGYYFYSL